MDTDCLALWLLYIFCTYNLARKIKSDGLDWWHYLTHAACRPLDVIETFNQIVRERWVRCRCLYCSFISSALGQSHWLWLIKCVSYSSGLIIIRKRERGRVREASTKRLNCLSFFLLTLQIFSFFFYCIDDKSWWWMTERAKMIAGSLMLISYIYDD